MRKKFRFLTVLAVYIMVLSCFSVTAFAYADDTEQNLPVTEATQPEQQPAVTPTPEKPKGEPIDDEGNAYTRDLLYEDVYKRQRPSQFTNDLRRKFKYGIYQSGKIGRASCRERV